MINLHEAIQTTPIIDHHAHNLLVASEINAHPFLSITSEASGPALQHARSTLSHLRAVKQLAEVLGCEAKWERVEENIKLKRKEPNDSWARECFAGIETVLIDDGLDPSSVLPYTWHDCLTRSKCKRIVRIERVAETITIEALSRLNGRAPKQSQLEGLMNDIISDFKIAILDALGDANVAGFKSVICYRTGLAIPAYKDDVNADDLWSSINTRDPSTFRLEHESFSPYFVHLTAKLIQQSPIKKPFQFHTGLGDNDINLRLSNPSYLQPFIVEYPEVPIVLLHASYPFTTEAGYLATVYQNAYLDIGEVFPFVSQDGQERVIRDALDLCPSEKLLWSTDGHWFPETYLLAVLQIREGLSKVLTEYVAREFLTSMQAVRVVQDVFFNTSNKLYDLDLTLTPWNATKALPSAISRSLGEGSTANLVILENFLAQNPSVRFLRLQWLDYTSTLRARILPSKQALKMLRQDHYVGIGKVVLGLLQNDEICQGFSATGEYRLNPRFSGLRLASRPGYATVQCEFQEKNGDEVKICPRTILRKQVEDGEGSGMSFLTGFEIEVVFMEKRGVDDVLEYGVGVNEGGHAWSTTRALHDSELMDLVEKIVAKLESAGIELQQFHPESCPGQYEFILAPLPPLEAVDALLAARDIISSAAADAQLRATLYPKILGWAGGTGAHMHLSITPSGEWKSFYAGVLKNLRAISAFTYSNDASYQRLGDGVWAGGTWIAWGPQNRETPLRQIEESHFEIKCIDGLANPYLTLAAIIGAGLQGIRDQEPLTTKPCLGDPSKLSGEERADLNIREGFPSSIQDALSCLEGSELETILGESVVRTYKAVKEMEKKKLDEMSAGRRRNWLIERY